VSSKPVKPLKLTPGKLKAAIATKAYSLLLTASAGEGPYYFTEAGSLPEGLSWNTTGEAEGSIELHGTPARAGAATVTIEAIDSSNPAKTVRREYTLTIGLDLSASLGKATATEHYEKQLTTSGGTGPYAYTLTGGSLPENVHLSETGLITGTPPAAGTSSFTIAVTDSSKPAFTATLHATLIVRLDIEPSKLPAGTLNTRYGTSGHGVQLTAKGGSGNYTYTATGLPPGLEINNGLITGTPTEEGTYTTAIEIHDAANPELNATRKYTLKVSAKAKK
jgi:large repetitive protein